MRLFIALLVLLPHFLHAQFQVSGQLTDAQESSIGFANILLLQASDSSFVQGAVSDEEGQFVLETSTEGTYLLSISSIGYLDYMSRSFRLGHDLAQQQMGRLKLKDRSEVLDAVEVIAEKPLIEQRIDRTIVNVENQLTTAGGSALEVLERSPGVVVDRQSNTIGLLGKEGVNVMINGRQNYLPPDALLDFLAGLNADNIIQIELITTPPANLDAQGNAGFINIILKKNPGDGLNGNLAVTGGYGRGHVGNVSLSLNYRKDQLNLYGSYNYATHGQDHFADLLRQTGTGDQQVETYLTKDRMPTVNNQIMQIGADYQLSSSTTVGVLLSGYLKRWRLDEQSAINIQPTSAIDTLITSTNDERNDWDHLQTNINLTHQFGNGSRLNIDLDYLVYDNENAFVYDQEFFVDQNTFLFQEDFFTRKTSPFSIRVGKLDYNWPVLDKLQFSAGLKYIQSDFENDIIANREGVVLDQFSNQNELTESILAGYSEFQYQLNPKTQLKAGLRYEYTDTDLVGTDGGQNREFGAFFPSIFLAHQFDDNNRLNVSYSKRINRPAFNDMASFVMFLDPRTFFGGNSSLQPSIAHSVTLGYQFRTINMSFQYTKEDSAIVRFQNRFDPERNIQVIIPDNLRDQTLYTVSFSFPWKPFAWWEMRYAGQFTYQESTTIDERVVYTFLQRSARLNSTQIFKLPQNYSIELSGIYQSAFLNGNQVFEPTGIFNFAIQKQFKNKARLTFNISDVFNSLKFRSTTELAASNFTATRTYDASQRTFKVTYSMPFGNQKVKTARKRESGSEGQRILN